MYFPENDGYDIVWNTRSLLIVDDILIVGSTDAEHDARVRQVLQRLKQRGVQLKKDKCEFGKSLGDMLRSQGRSRRSETYRRQGQGYQGST